MEDHKGEEDLNNSKTRRMDECSQELADPTPNKRLKLDQAPTSSSNADDPVDDDASHSSCDEDDTAILLAELERIKEKKVDEEVKKEMEKRLEARKRWDHDAAGIDCPCYEPEKETYMFTSDKTFMDKYMR